MSPPGDRVNDTKCFPNKIKKIKKEEFFSVIRLKKGYEIRFFKVMRQKKLMK